MAGEGAGIRAAAVYCGLCGQMMARLRVAARVVYNDGQVSEEARYECHTPDCGNIVDVEESP